MGILVLMFFSFVFVLFFHHFFPPQGSWLSSITSRDFPQAIHTYDGFIEFSSNGQTADFRSYMSCVTARTATIEVEFRNNVHKRHKKFISKIY